MQNRIRLLPLLALGVPMTSTIPLVVSCNKFEPEIITPTINTDENIICECSEIKLNHSFFITFEITNDDYIISAKSYVKIGNNKIEISELIDTYDTNQIVVSSDKVDDFNVSIYLITIMKGLNIDGGSQELHGLTSIANCDTKKWQTYFGDWEVNATCWLDNESHTKVDPNISLKNGIISWTNSIAKGTYIFYIKCSAKIDEEVYEEKTNNISLNIEQDMTNLPLNITALEEANINVKTNKNEVPTSINLSYSFDNETWYQFDFDAGVDLQTNQKIYLKGNNNRWSYSSDSYNHITSTGKFDVNGNPASLLDDGLCVTKAPGDDCFRGLFEGSNVSSVDQNLLKRFYLSDSIFASMFEDCSDLIKAPDLPNTISEYDDYCYSCMFKNCISLECAPDLMCAEPWHSTSGAYSSMFFGCKKLKYIKLGCLSFRDSAFKNWVGGDFSSSGDFYYNGSVVTRGPSAIPEGWEVHTF